MAGSALAFLQGLPVWPYLLALLLLTVLLVLSIRRQLFLVRTMRRLGLDLVAKEQEISRLNRNLREIQVSDHLTGMGNRTYLAAYMDKEIALARRGYEDWLLGKTFAPVNADLIFMLLDLDRFKEINDRFGHLSGDRVLSQIKGVLRQVTRDADLLVRWSGEEFLIVYRQSNRECGPFLAERLRTAIATHRFDCGEGDPVQLTCSVGFAAYPYLSNSPGAVSWRGVLRIAELSLELAKGAGSGSWNGLYATSSTQAHRLGKTLREEWPAMVKEGNLKLFSSAENTAVSRQKIIGLSRT